MTGQPATAGSPALSAGRRCTDAFCLAGLRAAGAVILGKANLSEWANFRSRHSSSGWSTLGGQAVNPHGAGRNPSGSSSGSGVAVAAALAPLAIGTETDGSIVSPAAACGVVGIKPTLGLVSRTGIVPISAAQDTAGPMARTVADAAALLTAMAGPDPADPATAAAAGQAADYTASWTPAPWPAPGSASGATARTTAGPATAAVLDAAIARLRACRRDHHRPGRPGRRRPDQRPRVRGPAHEFKHDLNAYLAALPGEHPATLAELIALNHAHAADTVLAAFGQDLFEAAEATSGDLADPDYLSARGEARRLARAALDGALPAPGWTPWSA